MKQEEIDKAIDYLNRPEAAVNLAKHDGLPVAGYRPQSDSNVQLVNLNKQLEEQVLKALDKLAELPEVDKRWLAIGRTAIESGFMSINRAIFKPSRLT